MSSTRIYNKNPIKGSSSALNRFGLSHFFESALGFPCFQLIFSLLSCLIYYPIWSMRLLTIWGCLNGPFTWFLNPWHVWKASTLWDNSSQKVTLVTLVLSNLSISSHSFKNKMSFLYQIWLSMLDLFAGKISFGMILNFFSTLEP